MRPLDLAEREKPFFDCLCLQDLIDAIELEREPVLSMEKHRHLVEIMEQKPRSIETGSTLPLQTTF